MLGPQSVEQTSAHAEEFMTRKQWLVTVMVSALAASCGSGSDANTPVEEEDPNALTWIGPDTQTQIEVNDPVEMVLSTANPDARAVRFVVDGHEVAACDPAADPEA